jgi:hypothetical protein
VSALKSLYGRGINFARNKGILDAKLPPKGAFGNLMLFQPLKGIALFREPQLNRGACVL